MPFPIFLMLVKSSTSNAWTSLLQQTEIVAKTRHQLAEDLTTGINDVLKAVASKKEEARKKVQLSVRYMIPMYFDLYFHNFQHVNFYHKLRSDRDKAYAEKDKAKQAYDEACVEVENLRAKLERGTGDQEKVGHCRYL